MLPVQALQKTSFTRTLFCMTNPEGKVSSLSSASFSSEEDLTDRRNSQWAMDATGTLKRKCHKAEWFSEYFTWRMSGKQYRKCQESSLVKAAASKRLWSKPKPPQSWQEDRLRGSTESSADQRGRNSIHHKKVRKSGRMEGSGWGHVLLVFKKYSKYKTLSAASICIGLTLQGE